MTHTKRAPEERKVIEIELPEVERDLESDIFFKPNPLFLPSAESTPPSSGTARGLVSVDISPAAEKDLLIDNSDKPSNSAKSSFGKCLCNAVSQFFSRQS
jgi:hypothetical protein